MTAGMGAAVGVIAGAVRAGITAGTVPAVTVTAAVDDMQTLAAPFVAVGLPSLTAGDITGLRFTRAAVTVPVTVAAAGPGAGRDLLDTTDAVIAVLIAAGGQLLSANADVVSVGTGTIAAYQLSIRITIEENN
jgi:hypothetical protein